jgi:phosphatidylglycerophosphate synthase
MRGVRDYRFPLYSAKTISDCDYDDDYDNENREKGPLRNNIAVINLKAGMVVDMSREKFAGDKKLPMTSLLARPERKLIDYFVPRFPRFIEGYHLTLSTILWSAGMILFGYLGRKNIQWLWGSCAMLFMQWFSDSFDGSLGRYRDTGIPKWGYYMDHFLDYIFMCAILVGYSFLLKPEVRHLLLLVMPVYGAYMVSSYLSFAATNEFKITYLRLGPTELRLLLIILNIFIMVFGVGFMEKSLPYALSVLFVGLCVVVFRTQKYIWKIDMENKKIRLSGEETP